MGNRPEDRQAFIEWLLEIVRVTQEGDKEGVDSEKAIHHRSLYRYVFKETQAILNAIRILYPIEVANKEKEAKIESVKDKLDPKGKGSEATNSTSSSSSASASSSGSDSPARSSGENGRFFKLSPNWNGTPYYGSKELTPVSMKMKKNG